MLEKRKGKQTRQAILAVALDIASTQGLEGLTIGAIAQRMPMSKSGVFAHFGSREELQIAALQAYQTQFVEAVLLPCLKVPRGLPRLRAIFLHWLARVGQEMDCGCVCISAASEYDGRPGAVRDVLVKMHVDWQQALRRAVQLAIDCGHLNASQVCARQVVFEIVGLILAAHQQGHLLRDPEAVEQAQAGFERMVQAHQAV